MTLNCDAIFKEKLTVGLKNNIRNLVNFHGSSQKSENLHCDWLLPSIAHEVSAKKVQKSDTNFEEKLTFCLKNSMRNLMNFNATVEIMKNCTSMGYFCQKYAIFELKNTQELCGEFSQKQWKVTLDKSSEYNFKAERIFFWTKQTIEFYPLDILLLV